MTDLEWAGQDGSPERFQMFQYDPPFHCCGSSSLTTAFMTTGKYASASSGPKVASKRPAMPSMLAALGRAPLHAV
eukprot:7101134-Pyramimonas_sp.AAC.1